MQANWKIDEWMKPSSYLNNTKVKILDIEWKRACQDNLVVVESRQNIWNYRHTWETFTSVKIVKLKYINEIDISYGCYAYF